MPRTTKKPTPAQDTITVQDAVSQLKTTEQALRLALIDIRPDDFDTVKALPLLDFEAVARKLEQQQQPQLPAPSQNSETSETPTQQPSEAATEKPQNSPMGELAKQQHQQLDSRPQSPIPNPLSLIDQLTKQAQEDIQAVDAIAQVRNAIIINNLYARDAELTEQVNQHHQDKKHGYIGALRDLASLAQSPVEATPDTTDLAAEIDEILGKLAS